MPTTMKINLAALISAQAIILAAARSEELPPSPELPVTMRPSHAEWWAEALRRRLLKER